MQNKNNLCFLLALGNQKVVVMRQEEELEIYTGTKSGKQNVSVSRLSNALSRKY